MSYAVAQNSTAGSRETGVFSPHIKTSELYIVDSLLLHVTNENIKKDIAFLGCRNPISYFSYSFSYPTSIYLL